MTEWFDEFRMQMPVTQTWAYFDHAAVAPLCAPARDAMKDWSDDVAANGAVPWSKWRKTVETARELAARLLGADRAEIALVRNTTEGVNLVAEGFPWQPGDNLVTLASEFPTNLYPWRNLASRGVEVRVIPVESERVDPRTIAEACDDRTRIVAVSWVGYATGWRNDLAALADIAHRRGGLLFVDAIQGLGVLPLDVRETPVDFVAADGHKWLLGPEGAGVLYVRREHLDRLRPLGIGWNSVQQAGDFGDTELRLKQTAARYEGGSYNMAGFAAFAASLELLLQSGVPPISERLKFITDELCSKLDDIGAKIASDRSDERWSGIVAVELPGKDPRDLRKACLERNVVVNTRQGRLRLSPHVYTNEEDIARLLHALRAVR